MSYATERELSLYQELGTFPHSLNEYVTIQSEAYNLMYASPILSHQKTSYGKHSNAGSRVERVVTLILASDYFLNLEFLVRAARLLYEQASVTDQRTLLGFWRGEPVESFPPRLLWRYAAIRAELELVS